MKCVNCKSAISENSFFDLEISLLSSLDQDEVIDTATCNLCRKCGDTVLEQVIAHNSNLPNLARGRIYCEITGQDITDRDFRVLIKITKCARFGDKISRKLLCDFTASVDFFPKLV